MEVMQGRRQDFQRGGGSIFDWKGQSRERGKRVLLTYVYPSFWNWSPWWVPGEAPEDIPFPCIWKPQIARNFTS